MNKYFEKSIDFLKDLIKIKSVKTQKQENMPFGKGNYEVLNFALSKAEELGFEVKNYSNYAGEVIFGEGNDYDGLAILCHLDVVPEGDESKWIYPPYSATEVDGKIYGRGVIDDKGASALCLYALKELKDSGFVPNRKIKLIFGCDEESGSECMKHYKKVATLPKQGFSPDGEFPVIYAEKGIVRFTFICKKNSRIKNIVGGEKINMVMEKAVCEINSLTSEEVNLAKKHSLLVENNTVISIGKNAHASTPEKGVNALDNLLKFLVEINCFNKEDYENIILDKQKLKEKNDHSGFLTFSPDIIRCDGENIYIDIDLRYPVTIDYDSLVLVVKKFGNVINFEHTKPLCVDKESKFIKTLISCYSSVTGDNSGPIAIGGGTYAKELIQGVAFGPLYSKGTSPHIINEFESIKDLETNYKIYLKTIKTLCE